MSLKSSLLVIFLFITSAAFAQNATSTGVDPDVIAREKQYWLATKAHDTAAISKLVADDFTIVSMDGPIGKKELLESLSPVVDVDARVVELEVCPVEPEFIRHYLPACRQHEVWQRKRSRAFLRDLDLDAAERPVAIKIDSADPVR